MSEASQRALVGLRDLTTLQWYVIPLLAIVFYIYVLELKRARRTGEWNAVFAGLTVFGMDFVNESINRTSSGRVTGSDRRATARGRTGG